MLFNDKTLKELKAQMSLTIKLVKKEDKTKFITLNVDYYQNNKLFNHRCDLSFSVTKEGVQFFGENFDSGDGLDTGYGEGLFKLCFVKANVPDEFVELTEEDLAVDFNLMAKE